VPIFVIDEIGLLPLNFYTSLNFSLIFLCLHKEKYVPFLLLR
jgi:hypothetical protein